MNATFVHFPSDIRSPRSRCDPQSGARLQGDQSEQHSGVPAEGPGAGRTLQCLCPPAQHEQRGQFHPQRRYTGSCDTVGKSRIYFSNIKCEI